MPDFWEFPTVSMGLGPINAIYQAHINRYLNLRRLVDTSASRVWCFVGDGEMDEPESIGALGVAGREHLDNLIFVVNCNLQRLDGPVRGNGKIIQELEAVYRGAGWNVIKVIWGSRWDALLARDVDGVLLDRMNTTSTASTRSWPSSPVPTSGSTSSGPTRACARLVEDLSDDELVSLPRGGHDYRKLYAAYKLATEQRGAPTVILAKTIKGWTLGPEIESRNATHQIKKMTRAQLMTLRDRLYLTDDIPDSALEGDPPVHTPARGLRRDGIPAGPRPRPGRPGAGARRAPGPADPPRRQGFRGVRIRLGQPVGLHDHGLRPLAAQSRPRPGHRPPGGTDRLRRGPDLRSRVDHRRGEDLRPRGQHYVPVDADLPLHYAESTSGQVLQEGITEAGALAAFTALSTAYATWGYPMLPVFLFYSMFGFQRVGDLTWALGDIRGRGILAGCTAGRTTLQGEGLQHDDGHSPLLASVNPAAMIYDASFAYEVAVIMQDAITRISGPHPEDRFWYLTLYNETYPMPAAARGRGRRGHQPRGSSTASTASRPVPRQGQEEACGPRCASRDPCGAWPRRRRSSWPHGWGVSADTWAVTSWSQLRHDALEVERWNRLHPDEEHRRPLVTRRRSGPAGSRGRHHRLHARRTRPGRPVHRPARTPPRAPTASGAPMRAAPCASTSKSTRRIWC